MMILTVSLIGIHALLLAQTQNLWQNTFYVRTMLSIWVMMLPILMVCGLALAMAICKSVNSATQFAIYMSVGNFGDSLGAKIYGTFAEKSTYAQSYTLISAAVVALIMVLLFYRQQHHTDEPGTTPTAKKRATPRYTIGISGADGGSFWSGAMRCPKCRADMEVIDYEGTEIDRCTICNGIWFDAGEIEQLQNTKAARAIDIGNQKVAKRLNTIEDYDCPRCSGHMEKMVQPDQRHIWFETCRDCNGSFFDAGEFKDLSKRNISDFFKGLTARSRAVGADPK
jgi:Zn-finger nucleic acid-binding protein